MANVWIGLGSNMGAREQNLRAAMQLMPTRGIGSIVCHSSLVETEPEGKRDQPKFINAVACIETELEPQELLDRCKQLEVELGRRPRERWGPREMDIDILLYEDRIVDNDLLTIPHPRLHERYFVLSQLQELAGDVVHPKIKMTIKQLWKSLQETLETAPVEGPGEQTIHAN